MLDSSSNIGIYGSRQQQQQQGIGGQSCQGVETSRDGKRGVLSQLIEKVYTSLNLMYFELIY